MADIFQPGGMIVQDVEKTFGLFFLVSEGGIVGNGFGSNCHIIHNGDTNFEELVWDGDDNRAGSDTFIFRIFCIDRRLDNFEWDLHWIEAIDVSAWFNKSDYLVFLVVVKEFVVVLMPASGDFLHHVIAREVIVDEAGVMFQKEADGGPIDSIFESAFVYLEVDVIFLEVVNGSAFEDRKRNIGLYDARKK